MKIVDAFLFYNELDMLEYRLTVLDPVVDWFVLVESTLTFAGNPKPLSFADNRERFGRWKDKIVHVTVDDSPESGAAWDREAFQRRAIDRGLRTLGLRSLDILVLCDVDEIPNPEVLREARTEGIEGFSCLEMDFFYYSLENRQTRKWRHPKILSYETYVNSFKRDCEVLRTTPPGHLTHRGGWHLGYFGTPETIQTKLQNFSHQEFNKTRYTSLSYIQSRISNHMNLFDAQVFERVPLSSNSFLPPQTDLLLSFFPLTHAASPPNPDLP
jgi:hypothetical protein